MDLMKLNEIVNDVEVIVMPGKLQNTDTQLLLVTGQYLPENSFWAIFPSIYDNCPTENLAAFAIIVSNLNTVMRTVPIAKITELLDKCSLTQSVEVLKQQKFVKSVGTNYFVNHEGLTISSIPTTPSCPVKLPERITPIPDPVLRCEPPKLPFKVIPFKLR